MTAITSASSRTCARRSAWRVSWDSGVRRVRRVRWVRRFERFWHTEPNDPLEPFEPLERLGFQEGANLPSEFVLNVDDRSPCVDDAEMEFVGHGCVLAK